MEGGGREGTHRQHAIALGLANTSRGRARNGRLNNSVFLLCFDWSESTTLAHEAASTGVCVRDRERELTLFWHAKLFFMQHTKCILFHEQLQEAYILL